MNTRSTIRLVSFICLVAVSQVLGQQVKLQLIMSSNPSRYLADWEKKTETATLQVTNLGASVAAKLSAKVTLDGVLKAATKFSKMTVLQVPIGSSVFDASQIIPFSSVDFYGDAKQTAIRTGMLPAGNYELCVELLDVKTEKTLIQPACAYFRLVSYQAPVCLQPANGSTVKTLTGQIFRWTPVTPKPTEPVHYKISVFEVLKGQSANQAFRSNKPILSEEVIGTSQFILPPSVMIPDSGKLVWSVQARDVNGNPIGGKDGWAEPFTFLAGDTQVQEGKVETCDICDEFWKKIRDFNLQNKGCARPDLKELERRHLFAEKPYPCLSGANETKDDEKKDCDRPKKFGCGYAFALWAQDHMWCKGKCLLKKKTVTESSWWNPLGLSVGEPIKKPTEIEAFEDCTIPYLFKCGALWESYRRYHKDCTKRHCLHKRDPIPSQFEDHSKCDKPPKFECGQHFLWWLNYHKHIPSIDSLHHIPEFVIVNDHSQCPVSNDYIASFHKHFWITQAQWVVRDYAVNPDSLQDEKKTPTEDLGFLDFTGPGGKIMIVTETGEGSLEDSDETKKIKQELQQQLHNIKEGTIWGMKEGNRNPIPIKITITNAQIANIYFDPGPWKTETYWVNKQERTPKETLTSMFWNAFDYAGITAPGGQPTRQFESEVTANLASVDRKYVKITVTIIADIKAGEESLGSKVLNYPTFVLTFIRNFKITKKDVVVDTKKYISWGMIGLPEAFYKDYEEPEGIDLNNPLYQQRGNKGINRGLKFGPSLNGFDFDFMKNIKGLR